MERLEPRTALTVSSPTIGWTPASNSGLKTDDITRVARPVFTGWSTPGTSVVVAEGATVIGVAKANASGAWVLPTPLSRAFKADGRRNVTATAVNAAKEVSSASGFSFMIDRTPPRATAIEYSPATPGVTVQFSETVLGVNPSRVHLTIPRLGKYALSNSFVSEVVGGITQSHVDSKTQKFQFGVAPTVSGTFTVALVATGITDIAGNPLARGMSRNQRI